LKKLLTSKAPLDTTLNVPEIIGQLQKMSDLLAHHVIAINENQIIVCLLINPKDNNRVQIVTGERQGLQSPINLSAPPFASA
jgi:hypothetical protein